MDHGRASALVTALAIALSGVCAAFAATQTAPLIAARWLPQERRLSALSLEPGECLAQATDPAEARSVAIGRAAFRTPLLLGGQAARNGLSCNSCHRNGRGNPDFFIAGLSDAPGTADVTTSMMSSHRGDGVSNPKTIPDLSADSTQHKVPRDDGRALETFIHGLIVEEFDGPEPSAATLDGIAAYVRQLRPSACRETGRPIRLAADLDDVRSALDAVQYAMEKDDATAAALMIASARSTLQSIDERYPGNEFEAQREALRAAARELASIQRAIERKTGDVDIRIAAWRAGMPRWSTALQDAEPRSLYSAERLAAFLGTTQPDATSGKP